MRVKLTHTIVTEAEISPEHLKGTKGLTVERAIALANSGNRYAAEEYVADNGWDKRTSDTFTAEIVAETAEPDDTADSDTPTVDLGDADTPPAAVAVA